MSVKVSSWVWHGDETAELAGNEMILLLALADVAADDGRCVYLVEGDDLTYAGLARKARVDRRTVIRLVSKLRDRGLLLQTKGTRGQPNEFAIAVPWRRGDKLSPVDSVTSGTDLVTPETGFGDNADNHSSYRRTDVDVTPVVPKADPVVEAFEQAWAMWPSPRRGTRKKTEPAFRGAVRAIGGLAGISDLLAAIARDVAVWRTWPAADVQYVPLLSTWLNQERWTAAPPLPRSGTAAQQKQDNNLALLARYQTEGMRNGEVTGSDAAGVRALAAGS
ncbi:MAG: hypothetical protein K0S70_815 [Microbacterium sp.]|jgi:hypothetical protein|nr:hypothetical protein [Microbacterium sp.]